MEIDKLRQVFIQRSELGTPSDLHYHFSELRDFKSIPLDKVEETVAYLLDDLEEIEIGLQKHELQMRNKDKDSLYYDRLI